LPATITASARSRKRSNMSFERVLEVVGVLAADDIVRPGPHRHQIRLDPGLEQHFQRRIELFGIGAGYCQRREKYLIDTIVQLFGNAEHIAVRERLGADAGGIAPANRQVDDPIRRLGRAGASAQAERKRSECEPSRRRATEQAESCGHETSVQSFALRKSQSEKSHWST
jgi:hypothetical protein